MDIMNPVVTVKDNAILLTLPNVTLGESVNEESRENGENSGIAEGKEEGGGGIPDGKQVKGEPESEADADEEEFFCHQHLTNRDRLSPELQDVYKILMQLPSFSHSTWSGFHLNSTASQKTTTAAFSPTNKRKGNALGKTRKSAFSTGKANKNHPVTAPINEKDSVTSQEDNKPESRTKLPSREVVKMHSINLYQSILPSSLFARNKGFK